MMFLQAGGRLALLAVMTACALDGCAGPSNSSAASTTASGNAGSSTGDFTNAGGGNGPSQSGNGGVPTSTGGANETSPVPAEAGTMAGSAGSSPAAGWWNPAFSRRRRLNVDARLTSSGSTLTDFPGALMIAPGTLDPTAVSADGSDVRFVDAAGNVLARDIEAWDPHGGSIVWLKLPSLPLADQTAIYMYYGASGALPPAGDREAVWPAPYAAVWHFAGKADDATPNHFDGAVTKATFDVGRLGQAAKFNAADKNHIGLARQVRLISGAEAVTESAWIKTLAIAATGWGVILGIGSADKTGDLGRTQLYVWGSAAAYPFGGQPLHNALYGEINPGEAPGGWEFAASPVETISPAEWHYISVVFDAKGKSVSAYSDGNMVGGPLVIPGQGGGAAAVGRWTQSTFPTTPTDRVEIGAIEDLSHGFYDGLIDELRIETVARSPEWLKAQALAVTGNAITLGPEEQSR
jgi:hypothetical protein